VLVAAAILFVPLSPDLGWAPGSIDQAVRIGQLNEVIAYAVAILGLNLVIGFSGQLSLGQSAFVGLGAYTTVILVADHDWSFFAALPVTAVLCFAVGLAIGFPASRIEGPYLAVATLALAYAFPALVLKFEALTGGTNGKGPRRGEAELRPPSWLPFADEGRLAEPLWVYCILMSLAVAVFLLARAFVRSRPGRALIAARDNPASATASGVNVAVYKAMAFAVSAVYGGLAGAMLMINRPFASDVQYGTRMALFLVVGLVIGGVGTIGGAIPGAFVYFFVPYYVIKWTDDQDGMPPVLRQVTAPLFDWLRPAGSSAAAILFGCTLLLMMFVMPGGIVDGLRRLFARVVNVVGPPPWLTSSKRSDATARTGSGEPASATMVP
jgi:branched-chain amino acid transport system permease protein